METLLTQDTTVVVDNGASTFIPLWNYILENSVVDVLTAAGKQLYVHTVITGGNALFDTLFGFKSLAESSADRNIIVWLNEYFRRIERDGKKFENMAAYKESEAPRFSAQCTWRNGIRTRLGVTWKRSLRKSSRRKRRSRTARCQS